MSDLILAAPEIFLITAISVVLLVDAFLPVDRRRITYSLALLSLVGTAATTAYFSVNETVIAFSGSFVADPAGSTLKTFAYLIVAIVFLYSRDYLDRAGLFRGEFFVLGLFGLLGIMVIISGHNLLTLYLGLELLSLSLYALVAFNRDSGTSAESAMKYFVLGAIASGTLLYGISFLYGITGTIELQALGEHFRGSDALGLPLLLALAFIIVGIAFKFGAVP
ncbi:MAG TPA: NADH:ubiquinone oxidoreductase subunit N, partial [Alphaproteobacteria bacterium]|nr:NADH:ubiquinone oxidoreductase subunit N [Alphaproteobacteria bacterium]